MSYLQQAEAVEGPNLRLVTTLAMVYRLYPDFGWETSLDLMALRKECVARARVLGSGSAEAEVAEATIEFTRCEFVAATNRLERVFRTTPANIDALFLLVQILAGNLGQAERARPAVARLRELDPLSYGAHVSAGIADLMAGRYPEALAAFEAGLEFEPESFDLRIFRGWALAVCGKRGPAVEAFRRLAGEAAGSGAGVADWCRA